METVGESNERSVVIGHHEHFSSSAESQEGTGQRGQRDEGVVVLKRAGWSRVRRLGGRLWAQLVSLFLSAASGKRKALNQLMFAQIRSFGFWSL